MSDPHPTPLELEAEEQAAQALFAACRGAPMPATLEARLLRAQSTQAGRERDPLEAHRDDAWSFLLALLGDEVVARDALEEACVRLARAEAEDLPAALGCAREAGLAAWALLCKARRAEALGLLDGETRALVLLRGQGLDLDGLRRAGALPKQGGPLPALSAAADALAATLPAAGHPDGAALAALAARAALDPAGELGLVGPRELARLQEHETRAPAACAVLRARLDELTAVPFRVCPEAEALRARVAARLERERAHRAAVDAVAARVSLACTYCHAPMVRAEAAFCAACLAPHHADCFREHGRCSAPGCAETVSVRAGGTTARTPSRRRWALLLLGCAGATAALTVWELRRERDAFRAQVGIVGQENRRLQEELQVLQKEQARGKAKLEDLWERLRDGAQAGLDAKELVPYMAQADDPDALVLEAKVEALFAEIFQAAEKRHVEGLVERFTLLRGLMREAAGKPVLEVQLAKWNSRLETLGEVRLAIMLQLYVNEGNQALRELAAAAQAGDRAEAKAAHAKARAVVEDMRGEKGEVFLRNADALATRADALLARLAPDAVPPAQEAQAPESAVQEKARREELQRRDAELDAQREADLRRLALEKQLQAKSDGVALQQQLEATLAELDEAVPVAEAGKPWPLLDAIARLEKGLAAARQAGLPPAQLERWAARLRELGPLRAAAEAVAVEQTTRELLADLQAAIEAGDRPSLEKVHAAVLAQAMELRATGRAELIARADALVERARALIAARQGE